jgi:hypothetical protein
VFHGAGVGPQKYEALGKRLMMSKKEMKMLQTLCRLHSLRVQEASPKPPRPLDWVRFYAEDCSSGAMALWASRLLHVLG